MTAAIAKLTANELNQEGFLTEIIEHVPNNFMIKVSELIEKEDSVTITLVLSTIWCWIRRKKRTILVEKLVKQSFSRKELINYLKSHTTG